MMGHYTIRANASFSTRVPVLRLSNAIGVVTRSHGPPLPDRASPRLTNPNSYVRSSRIFKRISLFPGDGGRIAALGGF